MSAARLVLASGSPRRAQLISTLGRDVAVVPADIDETPLHGERAAALVERLAIGKAQAVRARPEVGPADIVIGADTVVALDGDVLGKPLEPAAAVAMLRRLSGREHEAITGVALARDHEVRSFVVVTTVRFAELSDRAIDEYVATGEPLDKAGAYGIQGGAARFVLEVHGSYQNVVGLPVAHLAAALRELEGAATPA